MAEIYLTPMDSDVRKSTLTTKCIKCGRTCRMVVNDADFFSWRDGGLIQNCMPYVRPNFRETLITGFCRNCHPFHNMPGDDFGTECDEDSAFCEDDLFNPPL